MLDAETHQMERGQRDAMVRVGSTTRTSVAAVRFGRLRGPPPARAEPPAAAAAAAPPAAPPAALALLALGGSHCVRSSSASLVQLGRIACCKASL